MRRLGLLGALVLLVAAVVATSLAAPRRELDAERARRPSATNPTPRGLRAAAAWLEATGRAAVVIGSSDPAPGPGDVWLLVAPAATLPAREAEAFLAHAERGGLSVWALGRAGQPALAQPLRASRIEGGGERMATGLPGHPLLDGLALRVGGGGVASDAPGARPLTGPAGPAAAVSVPLGLGEVVLLAGPEPLDNRRIGEADALSLWVRLAARGRVAFDERWLEPPAAGTPRALPALLGLQALVAALALLVSLGRRHGAIRPAPAAASRRTARDYLRSLAALSSRAGAEPALARASWRRLRRRLEREAGVPARLDDEVAALRLEGRRGAAAALRRGAAALLAGGPGQLLAVTRAAAEVEEALHHALASPPPGG